MTTADTSRLPGAFEALDTGVVLHDPETGEILDANGRVEELYGYPVSELREMRVEEVTAPTTKFTQAEANRRIRTAVDEDQTFDWQIERSTGEVVWVSVHLTSVAIAGVERVLAEVREITEYKIRERRLRLLNRVIRHNLRNDTTVLLGYADRIKRAVEDESLESEIETILEIAEGIGSMSDSIKQFEEIADPNGTERSRTFVNGVVREVVADARDRYPDAELSVTEASEVWVSADRGLRYALEHAVDNAIDHNDTESPSVVVTVGETEQDGRGAVSVADDGPAIPDVEREVLDEDVTKTDTHHGSGIGLWVMKWCVDSLGGELRFEPNEPRGNVVRMLLPVSPVADEAADP
jgi:PAS domain S-box-containing protein